MNQTTNLTRRHWLRSTGALLALPFFESILSRSARAAAIAKPPVRMGIFTVTGGTVLESWKPATDPGSPRRKPMGPGELTPLEKLPSILRPLEFVKDQITVVSGLSHAGRSDNVNAHEHCAMLHLTGANAVKKEGGKLFADVSVDQAAANVMGKETLLPSIEIGLNGGEKNYSFRSREVNVPFEGNPRLVFDRMFRGRQPVAPNWQRRATATITPSTDEKKDSLDRSVLDLVLSQANDLRRDLGKNDQQKLDQYLESVRSVEKRVALVEARQRQDLLDLAQPGSSKLRLPENLPKPGTPIWEVTRPVEQDPSRHADYIRLMADMLVLAFQTDTTRVVTLAVGSDECMFPGVVTVGYERHCHTLEHQGNAFRPEDADPIAREACRQIHAWYTQLFAETIGKLQAIDEGGSTLLDNSLLLYTSYMADGGHGRDEYPVVLAGRAGGKVSGGRHLAFAKKAPMSNLYCEMLNLFGAPATKFGDSETSRFAGDLKGRLPGLFT